MNLAEIFSKLPADVAQVLETHLEKVAISGQPTRIEVLQAATTAVNATREEVGLLDDETEDALDFVPDATLEHLFGPAHVEQLVVPVTELKPAE